MKSQSDVFPSIQRLQGGILFPYNIAASENGYNYESVKFEDAGQDIGSVDWVITAQKEIINRACQERILDRFPVLHQIDVASGLYLDSGMRAWIAAMVAESNRCHDLCGAAQTITDAMAVVPAWPEYVEVV